ncbi:MAG: LytR C-terminal domain-containing protein [Candidatus Cloacimonadaceae bacterium]|jgi:hypothetical protein|nr:LytR C-terminal domain-containing protein [Candidatus Cloacimonadaceae bacterium]
MNEQFDLTDSPSEKKWYSNTWVWYALAAVILSGLAYLVITRGVSADEGPKEYAEDQLPAIKVTVLNGCGYEQLASEYSAYLADKNVDVVSLGDTPRPIYDKSIIVIRKGDMQDLERLKRMTGIQRWTSALNEYHNADFDIIIGRDFEEFMK